MKNLQLLLSTGAVFAVFSLVAHVVPPAEMPNLSMRRLRNSSLRPVEMRIHDLQSRLNTARTEFRPDSGEIRALEKQLRAAKSERDRLRAYNKYSLPIRNLKAQIQKLKAERSPGAGRPKPSPAQSKALHDRILQLEKQLRALQQAEGMPPSSVVLL